jgi:hypothetical protein
MAVLHIFNPEHDIALAANLSNFTAPHAGRQLRHDLGYLPAIWATDGYVLVENVEDAKRDFARLMHRPFDRFVEKRQLAKLDITRVEPWGWDAAMVTELRRWGGSPQVLPTEEWLSDCRLLSHRRTSSALLPLLRSAGMVGESAECHTFQEVIACQQQWGNIVVKAPWSSSGRGVKFTVQPGWINNVIERQGSVLVEPYYNKVKDFGMEFEVDSDGNISYLGLSLFHTKNGAYVGNLIATEATKRRIMARYLPLPLLDRVKENIIEKLQLTGYQGSFGVDMMVVNGKGLTTDGNCLLHPCVEINLRRTMGHVALSIKPNDDEWVRVMRIRLNEHYKLSINKL